MTRKICDTDVEFINNCFSIQLDFSDDFVTVIIYDSKPQYACNAIIPRNFKYIIDKGRPAICNDKNEVPYSHYTPADVSLFGMKFLEEMGEHGLKVAYYFKIAGRDFNDGFSWLKIFVIDEHANPTMLYSKGFVTHFKSKCGPEIEIDECEKLCGKFVDEKIRNKADKEVTEKMKCEFDELKTESEKFKSDIQSQVDTYRNESVKFQTDIQSQVDANKSESVKFQTDTQSKIDAIYDEIEKIKKDPGYLKGQTVKQK
jgi:hypothetical protein